jgi:ABC-type lipoprotein export system ATPase subunit
LETKEILVQTKDLSKMYGEGTGIQALDNVNIHVTRGEFLVIRGPSGSGKSTLLNIIGTLDCPTSGQVILDKVDVSTLKGNALADFRREKIGFIFQLFHLVPTLTVLENVILPLLPFKRKLPFRLTDRGKELLENVGLENRMNHLPGQLSGGEQQRTAIVRSLINRPCLILADEPTGNLDSQSGKEVLRLLRELNRKQGITFILATHDRLIASQADRAVFIKDGRLVIGEEEAELG